MSNHSANHCSRFLDTLVKSRSYILLGGGEGQNHKLINKKSQIPESAIDAKKTNQLKRERVKGWKGCYSERVVMVGVSGKVTFVVRSAY